MKNLIDLTKKLIAFDTVSNKENIKCTDTIADQLDHLGFKIQKFEDEIAGVKKSQLLASIGPDQQRGGLILSGHMDVVPFADQPGWSRDPLKMEATDEHIFGRGTTDMKAFIAQSVIAAEKIDFSQLKSQLVMIFTCDEEVCCQGAKRLIPQLESQLKDSPLPVQALIGEPTDFRVYFAHKGIGNFRLTTKGRGGHSSRPDLGKNAVTDMAKILNVIDELNTELKAKSSPSNENLFGDCSYASINVGKISGGVADNMIPEQCEILVSMRTTTDVTADEIMEFLANKISQRSIDVDMELHDQMAAPALMSTIDTPLHRHLKAWSKNQANLGAPYVTDAGHFSKLGIDSYICGPGLLSQAHKANESIPKSNFLRGVDLIEASIQALCCR